MSSDPLRSSPASRLQARSWSLLVSGGWPNLRAALLPLAVLTPLAAADGGYPATAWGWSALALLATAALALVARHQRRPPGLELAFLLGFALLAAWIFTSLLWTSSRTQTTLEGERIVVYLSGCLAVLLIVAAGSVSALIAGVWAAITLVSGYSLLTRLLPESFGALDPIAGNRLAEPLGYWNALGLFAAMGALLALGLSARGATPLLRAGAGASLAVLLPALYFTFSRGAWLALGAGLLVALALDRRRLQLTAVLLAVAPWPALAVAIASRADALTRLNAPAEATAREGHRLLALVAVLALAAAAAVLAFAALERRVRLGRAARLTYAAVLAAAVAALLAGVLHRYGSPPTLLERSYHSLRAPAPADGGDPNRRLFSLSDTKRIELWRAAWADYRAHLYLGSGAGTFEQYWLEHRPVAGKVRDAHSLYLETLGELGPLGLALLVGVLGLPLAAAVVARGHPLVPAALGAYAAYLLHSGVDWDWEITAVTLAALFCASALLAAVRGGEGRPAARGFRWGTLALVVALGTVALAGLVGNSAIAASAKAAAAADWDRAAAEARRAARWAPWSSEPWRRLGEAQLGRGDVASARASFRRAIGKEPRDWSLWVSLAQASEGQGQRKALAEAARLNPLSPEIADFRANLGYEAPIFVLPSRSSHSG